MTPSATAAELALQALGITEPEEIDIVSPVSTNGTDLRL